MLKLLHVVQWSWGSVVLLPMAGALAIVLLGLLEHLSAHASTSFTVEKKRPPRHIL
jgi:hypothetical protein